MRFTKIGRIEFTSMHNHRCADFIEICELLCERKYAQLAD